MKFVELAFISSFLCLVSCVEKPIEPITIGINPWPGYEYLYLAENKGFFNNVGLNLRLIQLSSLTDVQRAYLGGRVDGLASTLIEVVQATQLSDRPLKIVLVPDYSNGGDVIVSHKNITSMVGLKGKSVGVELGALGIFFLHRALTKVGLRLSDVNVIDTEQTEAEEAMLSGVLDAYVTYPPTSISILKQAQFHSVFSSADIPFEIIDTVAVSAEILRAEPEFVPKLHQAWQMALDFAKQHPQESSAIMAEREGISVSEFDAAAQDLAILDAAEQIPLFENADGLQQSAKEVCQVLVDIKSLEMGCDSLPDIVYRGRLGR